MSDIYKQLQKYDWSKFRKMHIKDILNMDLREISDEERLARVLMLAYAKHNLGVDSIGWEELNDILHSELCNVMGDKNYVYWIERDSLRN